MVEKKNICCPRCGAKGTWTEENKFKPFCTERCKLIDLGDWADEKHRVAGDPVNPNDEKEED